MKTALEVVEEVLKKELDILADGKIQDVALKIVQRLGMENVMFHSLKDSVPERKDN